MRGKLAHVALRVSVVYAVAAGLWILLSDRALGILIANPRVLIQAEVYKGWVFVAVTALMLYVILRNQLRTEEKEATGRKEAEAALQRHEEQYRLLIENLATGVVIVDPRELMLFANPAAEKVFGAPKGGLVGRNLMEFLGDKERQEVQKESDKRAQGVTSSYEIDIRRMDGEIRRIQVTAAPRRDPNGAFSGALATFQDITEKAQLEQRIERERAQLLTLIDNLPDGVFLKDASCRFIRANKVVADVMQAGTPENLIGKTDHDFYPKEMADRFQADERAIIATGRKVIEKEGPKLVSGVSRIITTTKVPVLDAHGVAQGFVGISRDVTRQKEAEAALSASERRYQTIVENITDALLIHDFNGMILDVNENACKMLGRSRAELVGTNLAAVDDEATRKKIPRNLENLVQYGSSLFEAVEIRKDGSTVPVEVSAKVVSREGSGVIHAFVRDLTERNKALEDQRKLREQLQEAQKIEAVGRLAGGIAHDFNNLLTVINGYCEMGLELAPSNEPLHANLTEIKRAAQRAATLTAQLLAFSRKQILQPRVVDLGALVEGMIDMIKRLLGEDIRVRELRPPGLWGIRADPGKIEQVLMNLAVNSRDAMPQGGVLSIETSNLSLSKSLRGKHPEVPPGEYVLLSVIDNGAGMDQDILGRVFEPFFTTKEKGKGTGLGLATVYGIVKQSEGFISCASEPGKGTTFKMYFPRVIREIAEETQEERRSPVTRRGAETILLVEDDEAVRRITLSILESGGYTVVSAAGGAEALRELSESSLTPDLLVTDVVMPGMNGKELAHSVRTKFPRTRVLFVSGYAESVIVHQGVLEEGVELIEKPFDGSNLLRKVRQLLDGPG